MRPPIIPPAIAPTFTEEVELEPEPVDKQFPFESLLGSPGATILLMKPPEPIPRLSPPMRTRFTVDGTGFRQVYPVPRPFGRVRTFPGEMSQYPLPGTRAMKEGVLE